MRRPLAFVLIIISLSWLGNAFAEQALPPILSTPQAQEMMASGKITLLDIRQPSEWQHTGVAKGAVLLTMHRRDFLEALLELVGNDKTKPIALICATGGRSAMARKFLIEQGFKDVADVNEGMLGNNLGPGWLRRGQPVKAYAP